MCVAPPIIVGAWLMVVVLWQLIEYYCPWILGAGDRMASQEMALLLQLIWRTTRYHSHQQCTHNHGWSYMYIQPNPCCLFLTTICLGATLETCVTWAVCVCLTESRYLPYQWTSWVLLPPSPWCLLPGYPYPLLQDDAAWQYLLLVWRGGAAGSSPSPPEFEDSPPRHVQDVTGSSVQQYGRTERGEEQCTGTNTTYMYMAQNVQCLGPWFSKFSNKVLNPFQTLPVFLSPPSLLQTTVMASVWHIPGCVR